MSHKPVAVLNTASDALSAWKAQKGGSVTVPWQTGAGADHCPKSPQRRTPAPLSMKPSAQWKLQLVLY